ncbi:BMP family ABC transporter substrate-binding protein [Nonomuraea sp. NPDC005650]|uniref:BMP family ABC transporter substrate-binding protein n=1 Tax=Nonomuraea sp. NPDC005650 TaxID=3157045 RepID=UPI0033A23309
MTTSCFEVASKRHEPSRSRYGSRHDGRTHWRYASGNQSGIAYDLGGTGDHGLNEGTEAGIRKVVRKLRLGKPLMLEASARENETAKVKRLRVLAGQGYNPVVAVGYIYGPAVRKVAAEFSRVKFAPVDDGSSVSGSNVTHLVFAENEQGLLAGAVASTKRIDFLGGAEEVDGKALSSGFHGRGHGC